MTEKYVRDAAMLIATIDPVGTLMLFLGLTAGVASKQRRKIALRAILYSAGVLMAFLVVGQLVLEVLEIPLRSFQIAGGIILFLFGVRMIFGDPSIVTTGSPEEGHDVAVFPLAVPSIASPGAMMAIVLLTDNDIYTIGQQTGTAVILAGVLALTYLMMLAASPVHRLIGNQGAAIAIRVMGMLLAALAVETALEGFVEFTKDLDASSGA